MSTINAEWLNQNSQRAYPFMENMRLRPTVDGVVSGAYRIPNGLFLDMTMATSSYDSPPTVYLSALTLAAGIVTAVFSDEASGEILATASAALPRDGTVPVNFFGTGTHDDIRGTVVFGWSDAVADGIPDGMYSYGPSETRFEPRCVRPTIPCVSGLFVSDRSGLTKSPVLRGDVALVAGRNVRLEYDEDGNAVVIHADSNYDYNDKCDCEGDAGRTEVVTVNGISVGNVVREGDGECVSVETSDGRIRISDTCSKPCCGCAELTFLNEKTNEISTAQSRLSAFAEQIKGSIDNLTMNVLLSDSGLVKYV